MSDPMFLLRDEPVRGVMGVGLPADWSGLDCLQASPTVPWTAAPQST